MENRRGPYETSSKRLPHKRAAVAGESSSAWRDRGNTGEMKIEAGISRRATRPIALYPYVDLSPSLILRKHLTLHLLHPVLPMHPTASPRKLGREM